MSKPFSCQNETWASLPQESDEFNSSDFVHGTASCRFQNRNITSESSIFLNESSSLIESTFLFPLKNQRSLFIRALKQDTTFFKIHLDNGIKRFSEKYNVNVNNFINYQTDMQKISSIRAGVNFINPQWHVGYMLKYSWDNIFANLFLGKKFHWEKDKWTVDAFKIVSFSSWELMENALRIKYTYDKKNQFFLKGQNKNQRTLINIFKNIKFNFLYSDFTTSWIRKINENYQAGLQAQFTRKRFGNLSAAVRKNIGDNGEFWKLKFDSNRTLACVYQKNYDKNINWRMGAEVSEIGKDTGFKFGVSIELNQ